YAAAAPLAFDVVCAEPCPNKPETNKRPTAAVTILVMVCLSPRAGLAIDLLPSVTFARTTTNTEVRHRGSRLSHHSNIIAVASAFPGSSGYALGTTSFGRMHSRADTRRS